MVSRPSKQLPRRPVLSDAAGRGPPPPPAFPDPRGLGRTKRRFAPLMRYVDRRREKYRSRFFMGGVLGTIYLGLHESPEAAHRAAVAFRRSGPSAGTYPAILERLKGRGLVPAHVLPKWTYRLDGGTGYAAVRMTRAGVVVLAGPYPTPALALAAMLSRVGRG